MNGEATAMFDSMEERRRQLREQSVAGWGFTPDVLMKALEPGLVKVGPHGYIHGWIKVGVGTKAQDDQLNELGGLADKHSTEASAAVDHARLAIHTGRYQAAAGHLENASTLLHAAGRHNLADAAHDAAQEVANAKPPVKPGRRTTIVPKPHGDADYFAATMNMTEPGVVPISAPHGTQVTGSLKSDDPEVTKVGPHGYIHAPITVKVGKEGYIHGWIFVGKPGSSDHASALRDVAGKLDKDHPGKGAGDDVRKAADAMDKGAGHEDEVRQHLGDAWDKVHKDKSSDKTTRKANERILEDHAAKTDEWARANLKEQQHYNTGGGRWGGRVSQRGESVGNSAHEQAAHDAAESVMSSWAQGEDQTSPDSTLRGVQRAGSALAYARQQYNTLDPVDAERLDTSMRYAGAPAGWQDAK